MSAYKLPYEPKDKEAEMSKDIVIFILNVLFELLKLLLG